MRAYFVLFVTLLFAHVFLSTQTDIYVSPSGEDSPACGPSDSPCATVEYAVNTQSAAGDSVFVAAGNYTIASQVIFPINVTLTGASCSSSSNVSTNFLVAGLQSWFELTEGCSMSCLSLANSILPPSGTAANGIVTMTFTTNYSAISLHKCIFQQSTGGVVATTPINKLLVIIGEVWLDDVEFQSPAGPVLDGTKLQCPLDINIPTSGVSATLNQVFVSGTHWPILQGNFGPAIEYTNCEFDAILSYDLLNNACITKTTTLQSVVLDNFGNATTNTMLYLDGETVVIDSLTSTNGNKGQLVINSHEDCKPTSVTPVNCSLLATGLSLSWTQQSTSFWIHNSRNSLIESSQIATPLYFQNDASLTGLANVTLRNCSFSADCEYTVNGVLADGIICQGQSNSFTGNNVLVQNSIFNSVRTGGLYLSGGISVVKNSLFNAAVLVGQDAFVTVENSNFTGQGGATNGSQIYLIAATRTQLQMKEVQILQVDKSYNLLEVIKASDSIVFIAGGSISNVDAGTLIGCSGNNSVVNFVGNATTVTDCSFSHVWQSSTCGLACTKTNNYVCDKSQSSSLLFWLGMSAIAILGLLVIGGGVAAGVFIYRKKRSQYEKL